MNPPDDNQLQNYQDDLDTDGVDQLTHELTDDPTEELGVPPEEFKKELDHLDGVTGEGENPEFEEEDMREHIEDLGENGRE